MNQNIFTFKGDWEFPFELKELGKMLSFNGIGESPKIRETINVRFLDNRDLEPDPAAEQLNAFLFILTNQAEIIGALYTHVVEQVFPFHKTLIDDEEAFFPRITSPTDLSKVLGLDEIIIHLESRDNLAYTSFRFGSFSADTEHGQTITLHKLEYIACADEWELRPVYADLDLDYEIRKQQDIDSYIELHSQPLVYQRPIDKYGKIKPWQIQINRLYPIRLIQNNQNEEFQFYLDKDYLPTDDHADLGNMLYWAKQSNNIEAEKMLNLKMGSQVNSVG